MNGSIRAPAEKHDNAVSDELLTLDEAAQYLKISRVYAGLLVKQGVPGVRPPLPHFRFDRLIRIDKGQLKAWLADSSGAPVKRGRGRPKKQVHTKQIAQQ